MTPKPRTFAANSRVMRAAPARRRLLDRLGDDAPPCSAEPEKWFADDRAVSREAEEACARCWVRVECLAYSVALGKKHAVGTWGGRTWRSRTED